jgi:hypothetical protein
LIPERIELFIDRLCSFFPTTNIARNTLKSGWRHSEIMLAATDEQARKVLEFCKGLPQYPSLAQIEHMFKKEMGYTKQEVGCENCGHNGWIPAENTVLEICNGQYWEYSQVRRCPCTKAVKEKKKKETEDEIRVLF